MQIYTHRGLELLPAHALEASRIWCLVVFGPFPSHLLTDARTAFHAFVRYAAVVGSIGLHVFEGGSSVAQSRDLSTLGSMDSQLAAHRVTAFY